MSWLTTDADGQHRLEKLESLCKQKDALYSTLCNEQEKLKKDLHESSLATKEASYKLSLEAKRATDSESQLEKRNEECKQFRSLRQNYESTIEQLKNEISSQQKENRLLQREIDAQADSRSTVEDNLLAEKIKLVTRNKVIEAELSRTRQELEKLSDLNLKRTSKSASTESTNIENGVVQSRIAELEAENTALRARQALGTSLTPSSNRKSKSRRRSSSFGGTLRDSNEAELAAMRTKLAKVDQDLTIATNQLMVREKQQEKDCKEFQLKIADLEEALDELRQARSEDGNTMRAELEQLRGQKITHAADLDAAEKRVADAQAHASTLSNLISVKAEELATAKQDNSQLQDALETLGLQLKDAQESLLAENESLQKQLQQLSIESASQDAHEAALVQTEGLKKERDHLLSEAIKSEQHLVDIEAVENRLLEQGQAVINAEQRCSTVEAELQKCQDLLTETRKTIIGLECELGQKAQLHQELTDTNRALEEASRELQTAVDTAAEHATEVAAQLSQAEADRRRLQEDLDESLSAQTETQAHMQELNGQLAELAVLVNRDPFDLPEVQAIQVELMDARNEITTLQNALHQAEALEEGILKSRVEASENTTKLQDDLTVMQERIAEAVESERCAVFAHEVLKNVHEEAAKVQQELEIELADLEDAYAELEEQVAQRDQQLLGATRQQDKLKHNLEASQSSAIALEENLRTEIDFLQTKLAEARTHLESLEDLSPAPESADTVLNIAHTSSSLISSGVQTVSPAAEVHDFGKLQQAASLILRLRQEREDLVNQVSFLRAEQDVAHSALVQRAEELEAALSLSRQEAGSISADLRKAQEHIRLQASQLEKSSADGLEEDALLTEAVDLKERLSSAENDLQRLKLAKAQVEEELRTASTSADDNTSNMRSECAELRAKVLRRSEQIAEPQSKLAVVNGRCALAQDSAIAFESRCAALQSNLNQARNDAEHARNESAAVTADRSRLSTLLEDLQTKVANNAPDLLTSQEELLQARALIEQLEASSAVQSASIATLTTAKASLLEAQTGLEKILASLRSSLKEAEAISDDLRQQLDCAHLTNAAGQQSLKDAESALQDSESALQVKQSETDQLSRNLAEARSQLTTFADVQYSLESANGTIDALKTEMHQVRQELGSKLGEIDNLAQSLADNAANSAQLEQQIKHLESRVQTEEENLHAKDQKIENLTRDASRLTKEIATLRSLVSQKDESASRLEATLNVTRLEAETLVEDLNACSEELERKEAEAEERVQELQRQQEAFELERAQFTNVQERMKEEQAELQQAKQHLQKLEKRQADLESANQRLQELEEQIQVKCDEVEETDERYLNTLKDVKRMQATIERLQVRCETLQRTVKSLEEIRTQSVSLQLAVTPVADAQDVQASPARRNTVAAQMPASTSKKRVMPSDFDAMSNDNPQPRAISVKTSSTPSQIKPLRTPPSKDRLKALNKPAPVLKNISNGQTTARSRLSMALDVKSSKLESGKLLSDLHSLRKTAM